VISIAIDNNKGKITTVQDCENGKTHVLAVKMFPLYKYCMNHSLCTQSI
jgi:hypothetical protein